MNKAAFSPAARRDLLDAVRWIACDNPAAARGLRDAVAKAATHIGEYRQIGVEWPELAATPYRFIILTGYPYVIVYNSERHPPLIVRVLHSARDLPEVLRSL